MACGVGSSTRRNQASCRERAGCAKYSSSSTRGGVQLALSESALSLTAMTDAAYLEHVVSGKCLFVARFVSAERLESRQSSGDMDSETPKKLKDVALLRGQGQQSLCAIIQYSRTELQSGILR